MKFIKKLFAILLLIIILIGGAIFYGGYLKYKQATNERPIKDVVNEIMQSGNYTKINDISPTFVNAMVAVEDKRFFKHQGVDLLGIVRAIKVNVENRDAVQGGSTITQQLAKNMYFINDNSLLRKVAESMIAIDLEKTYSKEKILELYFNIIYYGSGYYNIYDATSGYFGKVPSQISDYEATLLAGIPNAPSVYSLNNNPDLAKKRQKTVLNAMVDMDMITKQYAEEIISE